MVFSLTAAPLIADANAAMLHARGRATVNGSLVSNSQAVFSGDQVRTGKDSAVTISMRGTIVTMPSNSGVLFGGNTLAVGEGSAVITTSRGMAASAGGLRIQLADGLKGRFEVAKVGGKVRVVALEGRLSVSDGRQTTMLEPGRQLTTAGTGLGNPPVGASSLSGDALVAIALVGATAAATGIAFAVTSDEAVSPSIP